MDFASLISRNPAIVLILLSYMPLAPRGYAAEWQDRSPHVVRFIEVAPSVKLEVLDWGGSGEPVLLLAGHGDTAHVFDDFAPGLTPEFHVVALTRRGFGASSQPANGYDLSTMVQDISQALAALKLERVHLIGHSIAGDEMTRFALTFPSKVRSLIYLEAAYDRVESQRVEATFPKLAPASGPTAAQLRSPEGLRDYVAETEILIPEAEIRATRIFGPDGQFRGAVTSDRIATAVAKMVEHPDYKSIRARILAIYAVYKTPGQLLPRYKSADSETRASIEKIFDIWQPFAKAQRERLRESVPRASVVEIDGASHYVFISHRARVLQEARDFLEAR